MLIITDFLIGFAVILGSLFIIGINRENNVSQRIWVILWSIISLSFTFFLIFSAILENEIILNYALGGSVGYVTAVSIHTINHAVKELKKIRVTKIRFMDIYVYAREGLRLELKLTFNSK